MPSSDALFSLSLEIDACKRIDDLFAPLRIATNELGFRNFELHFRTPVLKRRPLFLTLSSFPQEWAQIYEEEQYLAIDPLLRRSSGSLRPFFWDEIDWTSCPRVVALGERHRQFGASFGLSIPIRGAVLQSGILSFSRSEKLVGREYRANVLDHARLVAAHLSDRLMEIIESERMPEAPVSLTDREAEFLRLSAFGLPLKRINEAMRIKQSTATYFTNRIVAKLGVRRLREAVIQAQMNGLIDLVGHPDHIVGTPSLLLEQDVSQRRAAPLPRNAQPFFAPVAPARTPKLVVVAGAKYGTA